MRPDTTTRAACSRPCPAGAEERDAVTELDGIVVGAGAAGLMAALRAASLGIRVAVLEADPDGSCDLARSGGMFSAAGTRFQAALGIEDGPAAWAAELRVHARGAVDPAILEAVTARGRDVAHFLADEARIDLHLVTGVKLTSGIARLHASPGESGRELAGLLLAALRARGGTVLSEEALGPAVSGGRVVGIRTAGGTLHAPWSLLASGGFAANRDMRARFIPDMEDALYIGSPGSDGRAIGWGEQLGAGLLFMDSYQGQGHAILDGAGRLGPGLGSFGGILVNAAGRRFVDETISPSSMAAVVLAQPGGWAIELFDAEAHQAALRFGPYREAEARGAIERAESTQALAARFGLPAETLAATLAAVRRGIDPLGRARPLRPLVPPFLAARVTGALAHTQGGLHVDGRARVLDGQERRIPGLLAAGGAAASISGHGAAGYVPGNGLAHAFALGMIAAETMATACPGCDQPTVNLKA